MPSAVAVATLASLRIVQEEDWRRERLQALIQRFRTGAEQLNLALNNSATPIQPVITGDDGDVVGLSRALEAEGIMITAIRPPTVPRGSSRLRITLTAEHTDSDIDRLLEALETTTRNLVQ